MLNASDARLIGKVVGVFGKCVETGYITKTELENLFDRFFSYLLYRKAQDLKSFTECFSTAFDPSLSKMMCQSKYNTACHFGRAFGLFSNEFVVAIGARFGSAFYAGLLFGIFDSVGEGGIVIEAKDARSFGESVSKYYWSSDVISSNDFGSLVAGLMRKGEAQVGFVRNFADGFSSGYNSCADTENGCFNSGDGRIILTNIFARLVTVPSRDYVRIYSNP